MAERQFRTSSLPLSPGKASAGLSDSNSNPTAAAKAPLDRNFWSVQVGAISMRCAVLNVEDLERQKQGKGSAATTMTTPACQAPFTAESWQHLWNGWEAEPQQLKGIEQ